jgi:hypothetical protein
LIRGAGGAAWAADDPKRLATMQAVILTVGFMRGLRVGRWAFSTALSIISGIWGGRAI